MNKGLRRVVYFLLLLIVCINIVAAFHAYKFTHFYDAGGVHTPRPEQMSSMQKLKVILMGVDYYKRPVTEAPSVPFQNITLTTKDDIALAGWYVPVADPLGTVIMLHGHGGNRSGIRNELKAFHQLGYNVCAIDARAHGQSGGNVCTIGYKEIADLQAAYEYVLAKGEQHIVLWGTSMGAATITRAMSELDIAPKKVILEMPFGELQEAVKSRLRLMNIPEQPFAAMLTFWGGSQQGFWAFGYQPREYATALKVPVLLQWGRNDSRVSVEETKTLFHNISSTHKNLVIYENSGHESLLQKEPAKWITHVGAFLQQ